MVSLLMRVKGLEEFTEKIKKDCHFDLSIDGTTIEVPDDEPEEPPPPPCENWVCNATIQRLHEKLEEKAHKLLTLSDMLVVAIKAVECGNSCSNHRPSDVIDQLTVMAANSDEWRAQGMKND